MADEKIPRMCFRMCVTGIFEDDRVQQDWFYYDSLSELVDNYAEEVRHIDMHKNCLYYRVEIFDYYFESISNMEYRSI